MATANPIQKPLFTLAFSAAKLEEAEAALADVKNGVNRAIAGAINKTTAKGKTQVKRGLTALLTIKSANVNRRLYTTKATPTKLSGSVKIMGRPIGLINFQGREDRNKKGWGTAKSGTGVRVQVFKGGPQIVLPRAFIAKGKFGNVQVFSRTRFGGKIGTKAGRLPIETQFSQKLYDIYQNSPLAQSVPAGMQAELDAQLESQIQRLLAGK